MDVELPGLAIALIIFQLGDAIACIKPLSYIERSLDAINCPANIRKLLPFIKFDSAVGLTVGLFFPVVGLIAIGALIVYFCIAIGFHVRARDTVANSAGAVIVLGFVIAVGLLSYLPAA